MIFRKKVLAVLILLHFLTFGYFEAVSPKHLATVFEYVHELTFRWKYSCSAAEPMFENFKEICLRTASNQDLFFETFGFFLPAEEGLFEYLFESLKPLVLVPNHKIGFSPTPCSVPFFLALDVTTALLLKMNLRQGSPGNSITILNEDFLYGADSEAFKKFIDLFAKILGQRIEAENFEVIARQIQKTIPLDEATANEPDVSSSKNLSQQEDSNKASLENQIEVENIQAVIADEEKPEYE